MFLTEAQVRELTGKVRHGAQLEALRRMGIDHYKRPDGRPIVMESCIIPKPIREKGKAKLNLSGA